MNRIASRALVVMILVLILVGGLAFFIGEFSAKASDWVVFSGSPHVYENGRVATVLTDRDGEFLADRNGNVTFSQDAQLRRAVLHWVGDREGNISTPFLEQYPLQMTGFDLLNGVYTYGEGKCQTELTLSAQVQKAALEAMGSYHGTVAVYNYKTGEILCALSTPGFDPENVPEMEDGSGEYDGAYLNRFLQSSYIPGSVFKIVTVAAALETIPDIPERTFYCERVYEMDGGDVTCEEWHGEQDLETAFANSCNCAFAQLVEEIGAEQLERYVEQFQVTQPVCFDGVTTEAGNFDISGAAGVEVAWSGIGQYTDLINPCRFLTFLGSVAGGGSGAQPHIIEKITVGGKTTYEAETEYSQRIMSKNTADVLKEYLQNNVDEVYGTWNFPGLTVCAKSGTGEVGGGHKPNAMFAGFVADEAYPLAFVVAVEEGGYGSAVCVPILSQVLEACKGVMSQ